MYMGHRHKDVVFSGTLHIRGLIPQGRFKGAKLWRRINAKQWDLLREPQKETDDFEENT